MTSFVLPGEPRPSRGHRFQKADAQFEEAKAARERGRERTKRTAWDNAVTQLGARDVQTVRMLLEPMPIAQREMYLLAEEGHLNREEVLRSFPTVGTKTREVWAEYATPRASSRKRRSAPTPN